MARTGKASGKLTVFSLGSAKRATTFEAILHLRRFYVNEPLARITNWVMGSWEKKGKR